MSSDRSDKPSDDLATDRLQLALRASGIGLWDFDLRTHDLSSAPLFSFNVWEPLGYDSPADVRLSNRSALWHPDDRARVNEAIHDCLTSDATVFRVEARVLHEDGTYRWQLSRGTVVRDERGRPLRFIGTTEDVTAFHHTETALRAAEERLRGTFENAPIGMCESDLEARFTWVNQRLCDITGYSADELIGKTAYEITHPDDLQPMRVRASAFVDRSTQRYANQKRYIRKDGSHVWVEVALSMVRGPDGQPRYAIGTIQDITRRRELEDELVLAKEQAVAANRAKDEFLANVSHEIRTPMNAIVGMTELVLDSQLAPDQRQSLDTVRAAAQNLLGIINDLLDFSRIESGKFVLDDAPFSLRVVIDETVRALAMRAHRKGLELVYLIDADVPDAVTGDAGRLRQILLNLVGNAIKFTPSGEVVITVSSTEGGIRMTVRDTGIGIPVEKQALIFEAFEQADNSTTRVYGGTGLGLTIATQLIALMGGTINVESFPGTGSTFTFTAKLAAQPRAIASRAPSIPLPEPVLVVDDHPVVRELAAGWLRDAGMTALTAASAGEAITALARTPVAVVLLDAQIPGAADVARASKDNSVVLMTTADSALAPFESSKLRGQLRKPLAPSEVLDTIDKVIDGAVASAPAITAERAPMRILVAEDNEFNAQLLQQLLQRRGNQVHVARNGREALDAACTHTFDAMLLDLHMPELDGVQVIEAIRAGERGTDRHLPVIALTARSRAEDRARCFAAGMDEFLAKPTRAAELWDALDRVVPVLPASVLDARVLLAGCGGDSVLLKQICETLNTHLSVEIAAAESAHRQLDATTLREVAHRLHGMVSAFSTVAGNIASDLEDEAARGDLEAAGFWLERLVRLTPQLLASVEGISIEELRQASGAP